MEWKPIETAPKDGSKILVYGLAGWENDYETYGTILDMNVVYWRENQEWWQVETVSSYCETVMPTHWMPLPPVPRETITNTEQQITGQDEKKFDD